LTLCSGEQLRADNNTKATAWSLDHGALVAGIRTLTGETAPSTTAKEPSTTLVMGLVRPGRVGFRHSRQRIPCATVGDESIWTALTTRLGKTAAHSQWTDMFSSDANDLLEGLELSAFKGMGCFVFKSDRLFLAVRCGELGLAGLGAHAHCDQLAIELVIDGKDCARDPGTYIYTASVHRRNMYRSASAHHVPHVSGLEPANLMRGTFDLRGAAKDLLAATLVMAPGCIEW
jgi:hypothetical protein